MSSITSLFTLFAQAAPAAPAEVAQPALLQQGWFLALLAIAIIVLPFVVGQLLAKKMRMYDDGFRIGLVLFSVVAGTAICWLGWPPRLGIDLSGGVILVYEVDPSKSGDNVGTIEDRIRKHMGEIPNLHATVSRALGDRIEISIPSDSATEANRVEEEVGKVGTRDLDATLVAESRSNADGKHVVRYEVRQSTTLGKEDMDKMVGSITKRVNPGGQKEVTVRGMGNDRVEVIIPRVDQSEIDVIKKTISTAGALKFRILANPQVRDHQPLIEIAKESDARQVKAGDEVKAEWVAIDPKNTKEFAGAVLRELKPGQREALVIDDEYDVLIGDKGGKLTRANSNFDPETGSPCVEFAFDSRAAGLFGELTGTHIPDPNTGLHYQLGILLDDVLITAPNINSRISSRGQITGQFTEDDVKSLVDVLNAGSLPAALGKIPVAEYTSSAQLGQDTIKAGAIAMAVSTGAILVFMLFYYRFAGFVADLAVLLNVLLVLALLILIKAHLTLAGVAGLVLSVGMSVDANVLIYERMREEMERGAALRMAIRNGFSRAMSTIIDSNLTTLIVGIVLYVIGTDQLRGFATTLILGLILNLFTAVYCARVVFDIAERRRWITDLKMLKLFGRPNFDFIKLAKPTTILSLALILIGLAGAIYRGGGLFGIDFTGGSSVQLVFNQDVDIADVRKAITDSSDFPDASVSAVVSGDKKNRDPQFSINTSNPDIRDVKASLQKLFPGKLKTQSMDYSVPTATALSTNPAIDTNRSKDKAETDANDALPGKTSGEKGDEETSKKQSRSDSHRLDDADLLAQADADADAAKTELEAAAKKQANSAKSDPAPDVSDKAEPQQASEAGKSAAKNSTAPPTSPATVPEGKVAATESTPTTTSRLKFPEGISQAALEETLLDEAKAAGYTDATLSVSSSDPDFIPGSSRAMEDWTLKSSLSPEQTAALLKNLEDKFATTPVFPAANSIGGKVAGDTKTMAAYALFLSNLLIIIYVWVRFQNLVFGVAAVVALIHDVLVAAAALALSYWLAPYLGFLQVDQFKISLDVVAALLTIVGFSINDTIVIFDRIREVRGKGQELTGAIVNQALNETLSRTVLTSGTVLIVTIILYAMGGEGIHAFAFTMLIGVIAGSYSSLFIAAPLALWMQRKPAPRGGRQYSTGAVPASTSR